MAYSAEQIEQLLKCSVCLDRLNQPKILPCQHTFCKTPCIEGLIDWGSRKIKCPECRSEHYVPYSGADGFPNNITIGGFLDLHPRAGQAQGGSPREDASEAGAASAGSPRQCGVCETEGETVKCFHCNKQVCASCKQSHTGQMKLDIGRLINQIRRGLPKLSNNISNVEQRSEQVKQQVEGVKSEIHTTFLRYIKALQDREKLLGSSLDTFLQGEQRSLRLHQENLEVDLASISSFCDSTESFLNQTTSTPIPEADMVNMKKQCSEYMTQVRNSEAERIPESRQVSFRSDGSHLTGNIQNFGEVIVGTPGSRSTAAATSSVTTTSTASRGQNGGWSRDFDAEFYRNFGIEIDDEPETRVRNSTRDSSWNRPSQDRSNRAQWNRNPDTNPYMFRMDPVGGRSHVNDYLRRQQERAYNRARGSTTSIFGTEPPAFQQTERASAPAGFTDGGARTNRSYDPDDRPLGGGHPSRRPPVPAPAPLPSRTRDDAERGFNSNRTPTRAAAPAFLNPDDRSVGVSSSAAAASSVAPASLGAAAARPREPPRPAEAFLIAMDRATPLPMAPAPQQTGTPTSTSSEPLVRNGGGRNSNRGRGRRGAAARNGSQNTRPRQSTTNSSQSPSQAAARAANARAAAVSSNPPAASSNQTAGGSNQTAVPSNQGQTRLTRPQTVTIRGRDASGAAASGAQNQNHNNANGATRESTTVSTGSNGGENNQDSQSGGRERRNTYTEEEEAMEVDLQRPEASVPRALEDADMLNETLGDLLVDSNDDDNEETAPSTHTVARPQDSLTASYSLNNYQRKGGAVLVVGGERSHRAGLFNLPIGVAVCPINGSLVVADSSNHRVQVFSLDGRLLHHFGGYGQQAGEFDCLAGVATNTMGQIVVADRYNHRVQVYDRYGAFSHAFGTEGTGDGQMSYPWGVACDRSGFIYVCDKENHRVQVFQQNGLFVRAFGGLGNRPGQLDSPHYVTVSDDNLVIVSDTGNHRIQVFTSTGRLKKSFGWEGSENGKLKSPKGVAVDSQGFIAVADAGNNRVQVFRGDGRFFCAFGGQGEGDGQFQGLEALAITSRGEIVVTDKSNHRVQMF